MLSRSHVNKIIFSIHEEKNQPGKPHSRENPAYTLPAVSSRDRDASRTISNGLTQKCDSMRQPTSAQAAVGKENSGWVQAKDPRGVIDGGNSTRIPAEKTAIGSLIPGQSPRKIRLCQRLPGHLRAASRRGPYRAPNALAFEIVLVGSSTRAKSLHGPGRGFVGYAKRWVDFRLPGGKIIV